MSDETHAVVDTSWTLLAHGPLRRRHAIAYDPIRQQTVLYGGQSGLEANAPIHHDTWVFANNTWSQALVVSPPGPMIDPAMAFDPRTGMVILYGSGHTWAWNGATWLHSSSYQPPVLSTPPKMATDHARGRLVMYPGWEWTGGTWAPLTSAPLPPDFFVAPLFGFDPVNGEMLASNYFGTYLFGQPLPASAQPFGQLCAGTAGYPTMTATNAPSLGASLSMHVNGVPPNTTYCVGVTGLSRTAQGVYPLPLNLGMLGMLGCWQLVSTDAAVMVPQGSGVALWTLPIPRNLQLLQIHVYAQTLIPDTAANPFGATTTNALDIVVGH